MNSDYLKMVNLLTQRTQDGKVIWNPTPDPTTYAVRFEGVTVLVDDWIDAQNWYASIRLIDNHGRIIDSLDAEMGDSDYVLLSRLHELASQQAKGLDRAFAQIFEELSTKTVVGEDQDAPDEPSSGEEIFF